MSNTSKSVASSRSDDKLDPNRYNNIRQATTMPGLPESAYKVKAAQDKRTGQTRYFYKGKRVSEVDGVALSTGHDQPRDLGVFPGVDIGPDGKIRR